MLETLQVLAQQLRTTKIFAPILPKNVVFFVVIGSIAEKFHKLNFSTISSSCQSSVVLMTDFGLLKVYLVLVFKTVLVPVLGIGQA